MVKASGYDNLIKKFVKEANKRPVTVDGEEVKIPWQLIKAMMMQESAGLSGSVSPKGAIGLLQVMPDTAREMGIEPDTLKDPKVAIRAGVKYFKKKLKQFDGDFDFAISSYNAGATNVKRGIKKYGRALALKYTHGSNFATHKKGHKDEGQSETQAYNRRIRDFYRELAGKDLPGESYYNAVKSLGYKYDKFATNRKGALDKLDRMTADELIVALEVGEIDDADAEFVAQLAEKKGRSDLAKSIRDAQAYERERPKAVPVERHEFKEPPRQLISSKSFRAAPGQFGSVEAAQALIAQIERGDQPVIATAEIGEPTIRSAAPPMVGLPPAVGLTSPVGLAEAAKEAVAPLPAPPVLVMPEVPAAPAPPVQSVELTPWQAVVDAETRNETQRTAPAVREPESNTMAKKRPISPALVAIEQARATNAANRNAVVPGVVGAPQLFTQAEQDKRTMGSIGYRALAQEYNANLPGSSLTGEEEFFRDAALAQYMGDVGNREVGFIEAFAGGMVDRDLIGEQQKTNQGALQKYRKAVGLGAGKSRRQLRAELANQIDKGPEARAARALENEFLAKREAVAVENERGTLTHKYTLRAAEKAVDIDLASAKTISAALDRSLGYQEDRTARRGQNISLVKVLLQGLDKTTQGTIQGAFKQGGGKEMPYVKRLYDGLEKDSAKLVDLRRETSGPLYAAQQAKGAEAMKKFSNKYVEYIRLTSSSLKKSAALTALNKGTPGATVEQAQGLLAGLVTEDVMKRALAGEIKDNYTLAKKTNKTPADLLSITDLTKRVGQDFVSVAKRNIEAQLRFISVIARHRLDLEQGTAGSVAHQLYAHRNAAIALGGADGAHLLATMERMKVFEGYTWDQKTKTYIKTKVNIDKVGQQQRDQLLDGLLQQTFGKGLGREQIRARNALPPKDNP